MYLKKLIRKKLNLRNFIFELTQNCNQNCNYCYNVWKHNDYPKGNLDVDDWKKIVLKLKEETKIKKISLSGGEPLLYPRIYELVNFIKEQNIVINLLTNGNLIDEKTAGKLKDKIDIFEIPLISYDKKMHQELKGVDDFDKVINGIVNIDNIDGKIITVFVATKKNIYDIKKTVEFGIALGSKGLMFNRINPACKEHIELMPSKKQISDALIFLNNFSKKYNYPVSCSIPMQPCIVNMEYYPKISHGYCPSGDKRSYYTIDSIGNVRICNHSQTILGNILNESFSKIIEHNFVDKFKKAIPNYCISCKYSSECRGGCKASAQVCYNNLSEEEPFLKVN
ncbi:MAG: radical SAM protein [Candidatus Thermoplasmatota archaeon]